MPTYEYECTSCHHEFEVFQSMKEAPVETCPECGKPVRRLISGGAGLLVKGGAKVESHPRGGGGGGCCGGGSCGCH